MPQTTVNTPSGQITVNHPDNASREQILRFAKQEHEKRLDVQTRQLELDADFATRTAPETLVSPGVRGFLEGAGSGITNVGRGLLQNIPNLVGSGALTSEQFRQAAGVSAEDIAERRRLDAPLLSTPRGIAGNITGNVATALPTAAIPGVNTTAGATLVGAGLGAIQPVESTPERLSNIATGGLFGGVGQRVGSALSSAISRRLAQRVAGRAAESTARTPVDELVSEATEAGFAVPPATANPTLLNRSIEGLAGKTRVGQSASVINQRAFNQAARGALSIPDNVPLTKSTIQQVRRNAGSVYADIARTGTVQADDTYRSAIQTLKGVRNSVQNDFPNLKVAGADEIDDLIRGLDEESFSASSAIELVKQFRKNASTLFRSADDPSKLALARANRGAADVLDDLIARHLNANGLDDLAARYNTARQTIAKTHTVEAALNNAGNIDGRVLARQLNKGAPLSGELDLSARFAGAFPSASRTTTESFQTFSPLDFFAFGGGAGVSAIGSGPVGVGIASIPLLRMLATRGLLSGPAQRNLLTPSPFTAQIGDSGLRLIDLIGRNAGPASAAASVQLTQ